MALNSIDPLALTYTAYGAIRGWDRGFSRELPSLMAVLVAIRSGCGLVRWIAKELAYVSRLSKGIAAIFAFAVTFLGAYGIYHSIREQFRRWLESRYLAAQQWGGGAADRNIST